MTMIFITHIVSINDHLQYMMRIKFLNLQAHFIIIISDYSYLLDNQTLSLHDMSCRNKKKAMKWERNIKIYLVQNRVAERFSVPKWKLPDCGRLRDFFNSFKIIFYFSLWNSVFVDSFFIFYFLYLSIFLSLSTWPFAYV